MQYKKDEIKNKIISTATNEFEKKGYQNALIADIAESSGVPVGNFYRYFSSKSLLFDAVVEDAYKNLPNIIIETYEKQKYLNRNVKDLAKNIAGSIMVIYNKYSKQLLILIDKSEDTKYKNFVNKIIDQIVKIMETELFKNADVCDSIISGIITNGFVNGLFTILKTGDEKNLEKLIERLMLFYFYKIEERI